MKQMYKIDDVVAYLQRDDLELEQMLDGVASTFPNITVEEVEAAFDAFDRITDARMAENEADFAAHEANHREAMHIFAGCPKGTIFRDAVEIKMKQGDPIAAKWSARLNSRSFRMKEAMLNAAYTVHPLFESNGLWIGERMMPSERELIEWFKLNHPASAREIERAVERDYPSHMPN
jgi:hypothetical protein